MTNNDRCCRAQGVKVTYSNMRVAKRERDSEEHFSPQNKMCIGPLVVQVWAQQQRTVGGPVTLPQ